MPRRRRPIRASDSRPGLRDAGEAARNMELIAHLPKPDGFFDPKAPAGNADAAGARSPNAPRDDDAATAPDARRRRAPARRAVRSGAGDRLGLRELGPGVQRSTASSSATIHGFNTYDIEGPNEAAAAGLGGVSGRPGRRVGLRQSAVHVGRADARTDRLRHAGRADDGQREAVPRHPHLRHHRRQQAETGCGGADAAAGRTRTRS